MCFVEFTPLNLSCAFSVKACYNFFSRAKYKFYNILVVSRKRIFLPKNPKPVL